MAVRKNTGIAVLSGHETVPASIAKTGTITSSGIVVTGILSDFLNEIKEGDWIYDSTQDEIHQVTGVSNKTILTIREKFSADIAVAINLKVVQSLYSRVEGIFAAAGQVDNIAVAGGVRLVWEKGQGDLRPRNLDPICVDATGTTATFTTTQ